MTKQQKLAQKHVHPIRLWCDRYGQTQRSVAEGIGMSPQAVTHWIVGRHKMTLDEFIDVEDYTRAFRLKVLAGVKTGRRPIIKPITFKSLLRWHIAVWREEE